MIQAPFFKIGIDIVSPLPNIPRGNRYIVVATDYITKWPEARVIKHANAQEVADFLYEDIEIEELLEGTFFQRLFDLIEVIPEVRNNAIKRVEKAQE
ncbi:9102_t:CDS:2, partial [Gigaspora rosea]